MTLFSKRSEKAAQSARRAPRGDRSNTVAAFIPGLRSHSTSNQLLQGIRRTIVCIDLQGADG